MILDKKNLRKIMFLIFFAAVIFIGLSNIAAIWAALGYVLSVLTPFIIGAAIALFLNIFMYPLEKLIFRKKTNKHARVISFFLTIILVLAILLVFVLLIVPQLATTIEHFIETTPAALSSLQNWFSGLVENYPVYEEWLAKWNIDLVSIYSTLGTFIQNSVSTLLSSTLSVVTGVFTSIIYFFIGCIFASYLLLQKENLGKWFQGVIRAFLPVKKADDLIWIFSLSGSTFSSFLTGQCLEAVILAVLCFAGMTVLNLPYALMISVITLICALIPVFGALFSGAIGALLILTSDPTKALIFIIFVLILQQVEGNLIYPRTMSKSIKLPAIWILVAVTIGGKLFGIFGMIVFIPICSVFYTVINEVVKRRTETKERVNPEKLQKENAGVVENEKQ